MGISKSKAMMFVKVRCISYLFFLVIHVVFMLAVLGSLAIIYQAKYDRYNLILDISIVVSLEHILTKTAISGDISLNYPST